MTEINKKEEYIIACMQLDTILNMLPDEEKNKIQADFLEEIKKYRIKGYRYNYDYSKDLKEQEMSDLTREVLYSIYLNYLCSNEKRNKLNTKMQLFMNNISNSKLENNKNSDNIFK